MDDQATTLRLIASSAPADFSSSSPARETSECQPRANRKMRCLAITGGKGGIGKSNISVNLAFELGAFGCRTLLLDADFGLANADLLCGVTPKFHLGHVFSGEKDLDEIVIKLAERVLLIPGGSGIEELANLSAAGQSYIFTQLKALEEELDFMLIDTAAGIAENVLNVLLTAPEVVVVVTPDPASIVDAYATIKTILKHSPAKPIWVVINNVLSAGDAEQVFNQLRTTVNNFLNYSIKMLGIIPHDFSVSEAVHEQIPVVCYQPQSPASRAIRLIAKQLNKQKEDNKVTFSHNELIWEMFTR